MSCPDNHCRTFRGRMNARCFGKKKKKKAEQRATVAETVTVNVRLCIGVIVSPVRFNSLTPLLSKTTCPPCGLWIKPCSHSPPSLAPVIISNFRCLFRSGAITPYSLKWKTAAEGFSSALKIHVNSNKKLCSCRGGGCDI